jgi:opacity protein-like surface antigen
MRQHIFGSASAARLMSSQRGSHESARRSARERGKASVQPLASLFSRRGFPALSAPAAVHRVWTGRLSLAALAAALVLVSAASSAAQDAPPARPTIAAVAGAGRTWEDEGSIGSGLLAGARVDRRIRGGTLAEVAFDYLRHDRRDRYVATGGTLLITAAVVQRLGRRDARPYLLGGLALAHHSGTSGFPEISHTTTHRSSTNLGFSGGGGLTFKAGRRLQVGPEARFITLSGGSGSSPVYLYWIGGRVAFAL